MSFQVPLRKNLNSMKPYVPGKPIEEITDDDVVTFLLPEIRRLILRG